MAPEPLDQWSVDDVATWLCAIGLGAHVSPFKENSVDGALLATLSKEDLQNDLGLSGIQAKKVLVELDFINGLTSGDGRGVDPAKVQSLKAQMAEKDDRIAQQDSRIAQLEQEIAALKAPPRAPAPTHHAAPPPPRQHHEAYGESFY